MTTKCKIQYCSQCAHIILDGKLTHAKCGVSGESDEYYLDPSIKKKPTFCTVVRVRQEDTDTCPDFTPKP